MKNELVFEELESMEELSRDYWEGFATGVTIAGGLIGLAVGIIALT